MTPAGEPAGVAPLSCAAMDAEQVLAFRLARSGLAARIEGVTREAYDAAVDSGDVVVAHIVRGAIHALAPDDLALYGRALIAADDDELAAQLGRQVTRLAAEKGFAPTAALDEVAAATTDALAAEGPLDKNALHQALRERVKADLMPWCRGCGSHHVAPMLWRYATVEAGARLDAQRRYTLAEPGSAPRPSAAVRRFLRFYGPATPGDFAEWAGLAKPHARRLWDEVAPDLATAGDAWILREDAGDLASPPAAEGVRLIPPGDPYLQKPNRPLLAPDDALRKRLFRPVASPGAVLKDGRLVGLWRAKTKAITVEKLDRIARRELEPEARRVGELRGAREASLVLV